MRAPTPPPFVHQVEIEIIYNSLIKLWLEDFYYYCQGLGGDSAEIMGGLLKARADRAAISITLNSFGTSLNNPNSRTSERLALYPAIGELYPEGTTALGDVGDESALGHVLEKYSAYKQVGRHTQKHY